jgi:UDP-glucose 4-epimerase
VRDYIHIVDLCSAHLLALQNLMQNGVSMRFNLGNGEGFSVQQVISAAERVTGKRIKIVEGPRREGDPARLVADATLAKQTLNWQPIYTDLDTIIAHAWQWETKGSH